VNRSQQEGGAAHPVSKGRTIEIDALPGVDLGLAVERQVVGVFGDQHLSDGRLGRKAAFDQPRRCRRLNHDVLTRPTGVFGPPDHQNPELGRHDVETLGAIFADYMQRPTAARAAVIFDVDDHLDPRQVDRQRTTIGPTLGGARLTLSRRFGLLIGFIVSRGLLDLFKAKQQLILGKRLGPSAEPMTLHLLDDLCEPLGASALRQQHCLQRRRIIGERIGRLRHARLDHARQRLASARAGLIHSAAIIPAASAPVSPALRERVSNPDLPARPRAAQLTGE
jgi:hypothetical protein